MAKIYATASGSILRVVPTVHEDDPQYAIPSGATQIITYDDATNPHVISGLNSAWEEHTVVAGVLLRNGSPVNILSPSVAFTDRQFVRNNILPIYQALRAGTATNAQVQRVVAFLLRQFVKDQ